MIRISPYLHLVVFAIAILFYSCEKEIIQYEFSGKVTATHTGDGIEGTSITISQIVLNNGSIGNAFSVAGEDVTDASGIFDIVFERDKATAFLIEYRKENYFSVEREESSANISTGKINDLSQKMDPKGWIRFNVTNLFGAETDEYKIIRQDFREGCIGCADNSTLIFNGEIDTTFNYLTTGQEYVHFIKVNVTAGNSQVDSVLVPAFDTAFYSIEY